MTLVKFSNAWDFPDIQFSNFLDCECFTNSLAKVLSDMILYIIGQFSKPVTFKIVF